METAVEKYKVANEPFYLPVNQEVELFEAVREMAVKAREENERLAVRVAALEAEVAALKRPV